MIDYPCKRVIWLFVAIALVLGSVAYGATWRNVTVIDVAGWKHEGVTVQVVSGSRTLKLISPTGGHKMLPAEQVRVIKNSDGQDITRKVLAALGSKTVPVNEPQPVVTPEKADSVGATPEPAPSESGKTAESPAAEVTAPEPKPPPVKVDAASKPKKKKVVRRRDADDEQPFYGPRYRIMLGGAVGYGMPSGDWYEGLDSGAAFGANIRVAVADNFYVGGSFTRQNLGVSSAVFPGMGLDAHATEMHFVIGTMVRPEKTTSPFGYVEFGFGATEFTLSVDELGSGSTSELSVLSGAGMVVPFSRIVGMNVGADLRISGGEYSSGIILGIHVGVVMLLGS